jgi:Cu(I)/Ag(I) efflux system membrane fusion protein
LLAAALVLGSSAPTVADHAEAGDAGAKLLGHYATMYEALVTDSTAGVAEAAAKLAAEARARARHGDAATLGALAAAAEAMKGANLEALREQFKGLSVALDAVLRRAGTPGWSLYYCPMADGYWIQTAEGVRNPYYGASMLRCGDKVEKIGG